MNNPIQLCLRLPVGTAALLYPSQQKVTGFSGISRVAPRGVVARVFPPPLLHRYVFIIFECCRLQICLGWRGIWRRRCSIPLQRRRLARHSSTSKRYRCDDDVNNIMTKHRYFSIFHQIRYTHVQPPKPWAQLMGVGDMFPKAGTSGDRVHREMFLQLCSSVHQKARTKTSQVDDLLSFSDIYKIYLNKSPSGSCISQWQNQRYLKPWPTKQFKKFTQSIYRSTDILYE